MRSTVRRASSSAPSTTPSASSKAAITARVRSTTRKARAADAAALLLHDSSSRKHPPDAGQPRSSGTTFLRRRRPVRVDLPADAPAAPGQPARPDSLRQLREARPPRRSKTGTPAAQAAMCWPGCTSWPMTPTSGTTRPMDSPCSPRRLLQGPARCSGPAERAIVDTSSTSSRCCESCNRPTAPGAGDRRRDARLYEGNRDALHPVALSPQVPSSRNDVLGDAQPEPESPGAFLRHRPGRERRRREPRPATRAKTGAACGTATAPRATSSTSRPNSSSAP